jgi:hypothetical protein
MGSKKPSGNPTVARFSRVELELIDPSGEREHMLVNIVPDDQADFYSGDLGESTPLAEAILGKPAGATASYYANGLVRVTILNITASDQASTGEAAAHRKAAVQRAITDAERTNALIFSTTVSGKWGDYDSDGMIENWDNETPNDDK